MIRGIRGATSVEKNTKEEIVSKTSELLLSVSEKNKLNVEDIASVIFSVSDDLNAEFPAVAARNLGWIYTPLFCTREIPVPGSLKHCIRVLIHVNSEKKQRDMVHVYLHEAKRLRPDIGKPEESRYYSSEM